MTRQEKGTRTRGLPPKEQLKVLDNSSGSMPTVLRFSSDGRPGNAPSSFDDTKSIPFGKTVAVYYPGVGIASGSRYLNTSGASDFPLTTTIAASGANRSGLIDDSSFIEMKDDQKLAPFKEHHLHESDAKSSQANSSFWATGSSVANVGEGFSSPLWSKQKIEIDISVATSTSLGLRAASVYANSASGTSFPMAYYNFTTKTWDPIGLGYELNSTEVTDLAIQRLPVGFANGLNSVGYSFAALQSSGYCVSDLGFPYHPMFHATSSQVLDMSSYITRPFLLEKAVIEVSGAWSIGSILLSNYNSPSTRQTVTMSINTCFLLNQRRNQSFNYNKKLYNLGTPSTSTRITASIPSAHVLSPGGTTVNVDTIRDILGFSQVASFASGAYAKTIVDLTTFQTASVSDILNLSDNDIVLQNTTNSGVSGSNWSGLMRLSMSMCSPFAGVSNQAASSLETSGSFTSIIVKYDSGADYDAFPLGFDGYRTGAGLVQISTRGLLNDFSRDDTRRVGTVLGTGGKSAELQIATSKHRINPYVLLPTDRLILGWQLPVSVDAAYATNAGGTESTFTFAPGTFRMTLYGSYITEGKEHVETLNQLLSSKAIHEIIG